MKQQIALHPAHGLGTCCPLPSLPACLVTWLGPVMIASGFGSRAKLWLETRRSRSSWVSSSALDCQALPLTNRVAFVRHGIRPAQQQTRAQLQLKLASANVLTLAPGGRLRKRLQKCGVGVALGLNVTARAEFLRAEFERLEYVAIGLQETRLALNGVHSTPNFVAVYAAADKGQLGDALWLSRTCAHGSDAVGPCFFAPHNVALLVGNPRLLAVHIHTRILRCNVIVAHAPHQLASAETKASYWASVKQCVPTHLRMWPCILLADANAAVGSRTSQHVGAANATPQNENGEFLHDVLEHFSLALPATMPDCQWGEC